MNSFTTRLASSLFIICVCIIGIYFLSEILVPLLLAFLLSILLQPVVSFLQSKFYFPHTISVIITLLVALLIGSGIIMFISSEIAGFSDDWPQIKTHLNTHFHNIQNWIYHNFRLSYSKQNRYLNDLSEQSLDTGKELMSNTLTQFSSVLLMMILIPIYTFLILLYRTLFLSFLSKLVSDEHHTILQEILVEIKTVVRSYIVGLLLEMLIIATVVSVSLMIIGVNYPVFIGVVTAMLNLIPYVGIFTSAFLTMAVALGNSTELGVLFTIAILFTVVHLLDSNILLPKVVSSKVKINALISMLGIIIGGTLIGISGMFLALPVIAIVKVIFDRIPALQPWGYLLGDDIPHTPRKKREKNTPPPSTNS